MDFICNPDPSFLPKQGHEVYQIIKSNTSTNINTDTTTLFIYNSYMQARIHKGIYIYIYAICVGITWVHGRACAGYSYRKYLKYIFS